MIPPGNNSPFSFHLAGIVPVHAQELSFDVPWHPCLMPIDDGYNLAQRSIVECAYAGCETIWLVCNNDIAPLVRLQIGDYVQDPLYFYRGKSPKPTDEQKKIPIFYVPMHPNDRNRRDSLGWAALYGAYTSYLVSKQLSKWVIPNKYYVSFPYGVYDPKIPYQYRKRISSRDKFVLSHKGMTVQQDKYLSFTFDAHDFIECRKHVRSKGTLLYDGKLNEKGMPRQKLPINERYSGRYFPLSEVFCNADLEDAHRIEIDNYHKILNWDDYKLYLESDNKISKPQHNWFVKNLYKKSLLYPDLFE